MEYRGYQITPRYEDDRWVVRKGEQYIADFPSTRAAARWIDCKLEETEPKQDPWRVV